MRPSANSLAARDADALALDDARELQREKHQLACEAAIALRDVAYGRERSEAEKHIEAMAMAMCLEDVPEGDILELMKAELKGRSNEFPPRAPDLLRRWNGESETVEIPNISSRMALEPTANERAMRAALPEPEGEGRRAFLAANERLFGKMRRKTNAAAPVAIERERPRDDANLSIALCKYLEMGTHCVSIEVRSGFGWWLLSRFPVEEWTPDLGREQWVIWQRENAPASEK